MTMRGIQHRAIQTCPQCAREFLWAPAAGLCPYCDLSHNARITNLNNGSPKPEPCGPACCPTEGEAMPNVVATGRLKELEATIEKSTKAVWEMAEALREIREDGLWQQTHDSWTAYCEDRWGIQAEWARRTIAALEVRAQLSDPTSRLGGPKHVKQASELVGVPEEDRPKVWNRAVEKARADGKDEPSLHRHLTPAMQEYRAERAAPAPSPDPLRQARAAVSEVQRTANAFSAAVDELMEHIDDLNPEDSNAAAYSIVATVHGVIGALRDRGHLSESVARNVTEGADVSRVA